MTTCLVIQHVEPEGPARLAAILTAAGVQVDVCRLYANESLPPDAGGLSGMVVMGGPMSATSDSGFPSRRAELALLGDALDRAIPVLGICLGAQLLALAAGGRVLPGDVGAEVGWGSVDLKAPASTDDLFSHSPSRLPVLHWHGDTYELPPGAVWLAESDRYSNQAFRVGPCAWGLQFHVEVDVPAVAAFAAAFAEEARSAGTDPEQIVAAAPATLAQLSEARDGILGRFAELVRHQEPDGLLGSDLQSVDRSG